MLKKKINAVISSLTAHRARWKVTRYAATARLCLCIPRVRRFALASALSAHERIFRDRTVKAK